MSRYLTKAEKEKIRENKRKQLELDNYKFDSINRSKSKKCTLKIKDWGKYE